MARKIHNTKADTIEELATEIEDVLNEECPCNYTITSPVLDSDDNKFHVIIIMDCFEEA